MKALIIFLLFTPVVLLAQNSITGKVLSSADRKSVPYASVFLSNSLVGAKTNDDGSFTLNNIKPGQYDLVISFIGFETHHQTVSVVSGTLSLAEIIITPKNTQLKEVTIGPPDPRRDQNLQTFIREFLGRSENALNCRIKNTDAINISFDARSKLLSASSDEFLIIENKALGYIVKYQLSKFVKDFDKGFLYYEGSVLFEEMKGKQGQQKRWAKARLEVYKGSDMHFLRSIFSDDLDAQGFRALKLIRKPNTARPPDSLIKVKLRGFYLGLKPNPDSAKAWSEKKKLPKVLQYLVSKPRPLNDFVVRTDNRMMLALKYTDYLYVIYTKRSIADDKIIDRPLDAPSYPTSILTLNTEYAVFDRNGIFLNPSAITSEGDWAGHGVADLLPVDYEPKLFQAKP